jgi:tetratricopeptide (TPR) repeat protein
LSQPSVFQTAAILGLGGIGKTRLALQLIHRLQARDPTQSVLWVNAYNRLTFEKDLFEIGKKLEIAAIEGENADVKNLVKQHLSRRSAGNWLLVLDNADDESLWVTATKPNGDGISLVEFLPKSPKGSILITSRSHRVSMQLAGKGTVQLRQLARDEAFEMLRNLLDRSDILADNEVIELLEKLAYLHLAIVQAAAYMNMTYISIQEYLRLLGDTEENVIDLFSESSGNGGDHLNSPNPVATTWLASFEQIRQHDPLAAEYLSFMACLHEKNIPQSLLPAPRSRKSMVDAIGTLLGYMFIQKHHDVLASEPSYEMHKMVHLAARNWLQLQGSLRDWTIRAVTQVNARFPIPKHGNREKWTELILHSQALLSSSEISDVDSRYELLENVGLCLQIEGRYREAVDVHSSIVTWREEKLGPRDVSTLLAYNHLGEALGFVGAWTSAEKYTIQALRGQKEVLGVENPATLSSMANLASTYWNQGLWTEAEQISLQVVEASKRVLGTEHPNTMTSMANLASTYKSQGRWTEAEQLSLQVVEASKRVLGTEHPNTMTSMANLASTYKSQGRWTEAEQLLVQVLEVSKRVLGTEHPNTMTSMGNLASTYKNQGRWTEAEELEVHVLEMKKNVLGGEHPSTLKSMGNLASIFQSQGRWTEAEGLEVHVLEMKKNVLGSEHPSTLNSMGSLASIFQSQGRWTEAEELEVHVLELKKNVLGGEHPSTLKSMGNLASMFQDQGRQDEAEELSLRTMQACEKLMGVKHPYTLQCMSLHCKVLMARGAYLAAERLLLQVLRGRRDILPDGHPDLLESTRMLNSLLSQYSMNWTDVHDQQEMRSQYITILQYAALAGHEKLITSVLDGRMEAEIAANFCGTALYNAAKGGHESIVGLLLQKGADANYKEHEDSSVYVASRAGSEAVVRLLLEKEADVNLSCGNHGTALHAACATGHTKLLKLLIDKGANLNVQCEKYGSPLHAACAGGHEAVVEILLAKGADANLQSKPHGTPLQMALANKNQRLTRILIDWTARLPSASKNGVDIMDDWESS